MGYPNITNEINTIKSTYLPRGGSMSGILQQGTNSSSIIAIKAGNEYSNGAGILMYGNTASENTGKCVIWSSDTSNNRKYFVFNTDGSAVFNGYTVITSKGGYTVNGNLNIKGNNYAGRQTESASVTWGVGSAWNDAPCISLYSPAYADLAGVFAIRAISSDGTRKELVGKPDGNLYWTGSKILTEAIIQYGMPNYNAGVLVGTCSSGAVISYTVPNDGIISIDLLIHNGSSYLKINGISVISNTVPNTSFINNNTCFYPVSKGDTIQVYTKYTGTSYCSQKIYFYPFKGSK